MNTIKIRRGTYLTWQNSNPTLAPGEMGFVTDRGLIKIGDGTTAWNDLSFRIDGGELPAQSINVEGSIISNFNFRMIKNGSSVGLIKNVSGSTLVLSDSEIASIISTNPDYFVVESNENSVDSLTNQSIEFKYSYLYNQNKLTKKIIFSPISTVYNQLVQLGISDASDKMQNAFNFNLSDYIKSEGNDVFTFSDNLNNAYETNRRLASLIESSKISLETSEDNVFESITETIVSENSPRVNPADFFEQKTNEILIKTKKKVLNIDENQQLTTEQINELNIVANNTKNILNKDIEEFSKGNRFSSKKFVRKLYESVGDLKQNKTNEIEQSANSASVEASVVLNTSTPVPTSTSTPVPASTSTPVPTSTATPVPTSTATPVPTSTATPVPTSTATPVPTNTSAPVPTATLDPIPIEAEYSVTIEQVPTIQLDSSGLSGNGTITNPVSSTTYSSSVKKFTAIYSGTLNWSAYIGSDGGNSTYMELQLADGTPLQRLSGESENRSGSYSVVAGTQYQIRSHYGGSRITSMRIADNSIPNAYYIDGSLNPELFFEESKRYRFDVSDSSNSGFNFRLSTTEDGIHNGGTEYSVVDVQGNPGETGSYVDVIIPINAQIYYYNVENSNFGNPLRTRNLVLGNAYLNYIKTSPVSTIYIGNSYLDYAIVNAVASKNINLGSSYLNYIIEV